jgi:hypothetical protein
MLYPKWTKRVRAKRERQCDDMITLTATHSPPRDTLGYMDTPRWAKRRRRREVYRAARAQGDSKARAMHLANVAARRKLTVTTALDGRTAWN